ncbi:MAG: tail tape measure protein [Novosphingobium sp.]
MNDQVDSLLIDVRASTAGFAQDIATMRAGFDGTLVEGFSRAGDVLERGLLGAIRRGSVGFEDLKRVALNTVNEIAAQSVRNLLGGSAGGPGGAGSLVGIGSSLIGSLLGLPGRATGGPVAPGAAYMVGERGPELFVPTTSGRIDNTTLGGRAPREVRVSINVVTPHGSSSSQALQRSTRQIASAVRRSVLAS